MAADLVFVNGSVLTVDPRFRVVRGLAVRHGRIAAVGEEAEARALAGPGTRVVDLRGGAVLPGINDSHLHAAMLGAYWPGLWMDGLAGGAMPEPRALRTEADRRAALRRAWDVLLPLGITSYTEPGVGPGGDGQHGGACGAGMYATYAALAGELPLRVNLLLLFGELDGPAEPDDLARGLRAYAPPGGDPRRLRVAGVKLFADGIPPMRTAWMSEPYTDGGHGAPITRGADDAEKWAKLRAMMRYAHRAGHQVGVHATGSAAVTSAAIVLAGLGHGPRHYIVHGDCASPDALTTMADGGVGLSTQPSLYAATGHLLEEAIGTPRAAAAFPLRDALAAGVPVALGSDAPVLTPDWRAAVAAAALRERGPEQRIAVADAIRGYTVAGAWQDHADDWKGTLEPGKVADLCVLARDPLAVRPEEIPAIDVVMTVVGGAVAYER